MKALTTFFQRIYYSCAVPSYYVHIMELGFWRAFGYLCALLALATAVVLLPVMVGIARFDAHGFARMTHEEVVTAFPEELVVTFGTGGISINQERPYPVPVPEHWKEFMGDDETGEFNYEYLVVFAEGENLTFQEALDFQAFVIVTDTAIIGIENLETGELRVIPIGEDAFAEMEEDLMIDRKTIQELPVDRWLTHWLVSKAFYVPAIGILFFLTIFLASLVFTLFSILILSVAVFVAVHLFFRRPFSFGTIYTVAIHTATPLLLLFVLTSLLGIGGLPRMIRLLIHFTWTMIVLRIIMLQMMSSEPRGNGAGQMGRN